MLRNNADARRCLYFDLGLPVLSVSGSLFCFITFLWTVNDFSPSIGHCTFFKKKQQEEMNCKIYL